MLKKFSNSHKHRTFDFQVFSRYPYLSFFISKGSTSAANAKYVEMIVDIAFAVVPFILGFGAAGLIGSAAIRTAKDVMNSISLLQTLDRIEKFRPPKGPDCTLPGGGGGGGGGTPPVPPDIKSNRKEQRGSYIRLSIFFPCLLRI
jgi:hypothetical protein